MSDKEHPAPASFFFYSFLSLSLGPDEQNRSTTGRKIRYKLHGSFKEAQSLLEVNDIDTVPFTEDVISHLRIPAVRLVSEMDTRFK
jgi:hypothetical protein